MLISCCIQGPGGDLFFGVFFFLEFNLQIIFFPLHDRLRWRVAAALKQIVRLWSALAPFELLSI